MKLAYADRAEYLGDPAFVTVPVRGLTLEALRRQTAGVDPEADRARPCLGDQSDRPGTPYESDQTTHFSVVDADGNAVANTYTLNLSYGVGLVADGTGDAAQQRARRFCRQAGCAQCLRAHRWQSQRA